MSRRATPLTREEAEALALQVVAFLAEEPERLARFLTLTGLAPAELRAALSTPELQVAAMTHLRSDESLLLVFAATRAIEPGRVTEAERLLTPGG
jgi:hypothetical protein